MGLYIHVPFCKTKCPYCDFNTYQGIESQMGAFVEAVASELQLWGMALGGPRVRTVFFGGGTPSYLPDGAIAEILEAAVRAFVVNADAEITLEANPGDLDRDACRSLLRQGVNRLSIGVQSLDNGLLQLLGRRHSADGAVEAFRTAREAGFENINLDLMYGLPNQHLSQWEDTITRLAELAPEHISLYALTLEEGTPMHLWAKQGRIPEPDPDMAADMYASARKVLSDAGFHHYEISNWSRPGLESRHNLVYWRNEPYLGVGPGAHSRLGTTGSGRSCRHGSTPNGRRVGRRQCAWNGTSSGKRNSKSRAQWRGGSTSTQTRPARRQCSWACGCWTDWTWTKPPTPSGRTFRAATRPRSGNYWISGCFRKRTA